MFRSFDYPFKGKVSSFLYNASRIFYLSFIERTQSCLSFRKYELSLAKCAHFWGWCCGGLDPVIDAHEVCLMAHLIAKLGIDALKPQLVGKLWRKPVLSGRKAADLKKQFLAEGK